MKLNRNANIYAENGKGVNIANQDTVFDGRL